MKMSERRSTKTWLRLAAGIELDLRPADRAESAERRSRLKHEPGRGAHEAGIGSRGADERREIHRRDRPMRERARDCGHRHEQKKSRSAKAARNRRPERDQPDGVEQHVSPRAMHERVGQQRPGLRAPAQHMQFPDLPRLLQRRRVGVRPVDEIDEPIRPDGDGQAARNERIVPDDAVLDRHGGPIEGRVDPDENGDEGKDHNGRIEHRFAAARDPALFVCAHTLFSLSVPNPDAPLCRSRDRRRRETPPPDARHGHQSKPAPQLWRIWGASVAPQGPRERLHENEPSPYCRSRGMRLIALDHDDAHSRRTPHGLLR